LAPNGIHSELFSIEASTVGGILAWLSGQRHGLDVATDHVARLSTYVRRYQIVATCSGSTHQNARWVAVFAEPFLSALGGLDTVGALRGHIASDLRKRGMA